jgi:ATP adenylyltransferase
MVLRPEGVVFHDQIWAPWRLGYIQGQSSAPQSPDAELKLLPDADPACFLCRAVADTADRQNMVVLRGEQTVAILNRYPYNNAHLLIAPVLHKPRLAQLTDAEHLESMQVVARMTGVLEKLFKAEGFNIGLNLGRVAGAGVPGHLHWHIVPRWAGDTNFMPVTAGVRVIPQSLDATWEALQNELNSK